MYRTGDRGIERPDGQIEFRGRVDRQTKIRRLRIELDEISEHLSRRPRVDFATATASPGKSGENQLVAYVLPKENVAVPMQTSCNDTCCAGFRTDMIRRSSYACMRCRCRRTAKLIYETSSPTEADLLEGMAAKAPASPIKKSCSA